MAVLSLFCKAQDTSKVMLYNLLQFPDEKPERISFLKTIVQEVKPEILMVCELSSNAGSISILTQALNVNGTSSYQRASFWDDGSLNNMLYYDKELYKLIGQDTIDCSPRFATVYSLLKRTSEAGDSIVLNFIVVHLKAGNSDAAARGVAANKIRRYVDQEMNGENTFLAGDFNIYSPKEAAFQTFTQKGGARFNDPIDAIGEWSNTLSYAKVHTQSTRTANFGGGSSGGMDDRFDWILATKDVLTGENKVSYVDGSYEAFGNDGVHFNKAINSGGNSAVSATMAKALHEMSDHLPVVMELSLEVPNSIKDVEQLYRITARTHRRRVVLESSVLFKGAKVDIFDLNGRNILSAIWAPQIPIWESSEILQSGVYLVKVSFENKIIVRKLIIDPAN